MLRSRVIDDCGSELVEIALVAPLLIMLLGGAAWVGRAYNIYATLTRAATEGARYAATPTCFTCGTPKPYPSVTETQATINSFLNASALPNVVASCPPPDPATDSHCIQALVQAVTLPGNFAGVEVKLSMNEYLWLALVPQLSIPISADVQMRAE